MNITSYADLLEAAMGQTEPQRLLFVFAQAELPSDPTGAQKRQFQSGEGGALTPVMCVDKSPHELGSFASLVDESHRTGQRWDIAFVSSISGRGGIAPGGAEADQPLRMMIEAIKKGAIGNFLAFNRDGDLVQLTQGNAG
ncbi:MAG: ribonucleotide reductase subunit alpha [Casimicrobiaceae bacterium]|nr:ribonucleotide reductase subunit alpha [Pseudomonadota bacterium]